MAKLFVMAGKDYTRNVVVPSYQVERLPVYTAWTAANHITHRDITRYQFKGSLKLRFRCADFARAWLQQLAAATTAGGFVPCVLYDERTDDVYDANCFLDFKLPDDLPLYGTGEQADIAVTITER